MPKRTAIHTWRAYKIRKKMEFVGLVRAATEQEAIEAACEDYPRRTRSAGSW